MPWLNRISPASSPLGTPKAGALPPGTTASAFRQLRVSREERGTYTRGTAAVLPALKMLASSASEENRVTEQPFPSWIRPLPSGWVWEKFMMTPSSRRVAVTPSATVILWVSVLPVIL